MAANHSLPVQFFWAVARYDLIFICISGAYTETGVEEMHAYKRVGFWLVLLGCTYANCYLQLNRAVPFQLTSGAASHIMMAASATSSLAPCQTLPILSRKADRAFLCACQRDGFRVAVGTLVSVPCVYSYQPVSEREFQANMIPMPVNRQFRFVNYLAAWIFTRSIALAIETVGQQNCYLNRVTLTFYRFSL